MRPKAGYVGRSINLVNQTHGGGGDINSIKNERRDITIDSTDIKRIISYGQLYANTSDNLEEMDKFLKRHKANICSRRKR